MYSTIYFCNKLRPILLNSRCYNPHVIAPSRPTRALRLRRFIDLQASGSNFLKNQPDLLEPNSEDAQLWQLSSLAKSANKFIHALFLASSTSTTIAGEAIHMRWNEVIKNPRPAAFHRKLACSLSGPQGYSEAQTEDDKSERVLVSYHYCFSCPSFLFLLFDRWPLNTWFIIFISIGNIPKTAGASTGKAGVLARVHYSRLLLLDEHSPSDETRTYDVVGSKVDFKKLTSVRFYFRDLFTHPLKKWLCSGFAPGHWSDRNFHSLMLASLYVLSEVCLRELHMSV